MLKRKTKKLGIRKLNPRNKLDAKIIQEHKEAIRGGRGLTEVFNIDENTTH